MSWFDIATKFKEWTMIICVPILIVFLLIAIIEDPISVPVKKGFWHSFKKFLYRSWRYWK